jgi:hypothetical protein
MMTTEEILMLLVGAIAITVGTVWLIVTMPPVLGNEAADAYKAARSIMRLVAYNKGCAPVPETTIFQASFIVADLPVALLRAAAQEVHYEILSTPQAALCAKLKPDVEAAIAATSQLFEGFPARSPAPHKR